MFDYLHNDYVGHCQFPEVYTQYFASCHPLQPSCNWLSLYSHLNSSYCFDISESSQDQTLNPLSTKPVANHYNHYTKNTRGSG